MLSTLHTLLFNILTHILYQVRIVVNPVCKVVSNQPLSDTSNCGISSYALRPMSTFPNMFGCAGFHHRSLTTTHLVHSTDSTKLCMCQRHHCGNMHVLYSTQAINATPCNFEDEALLNTMQCLIVCMYASKLSCNLVNPEIHNMQGCSTTTNDGATLLECLVSTQAWHSCLQMCRAKFSRKLICDKTHEVLGTEKHP